jgi:HEAT repeat protein
MRTAGVEVLGEVPGAIPLRPVVALLDDKAERVRIRAAEVLARRGDAEAIEPLRARLEGGKASPAEAEALGRALASVAPTRVAALLAGWLEPERRFLRGISAAQRTLQWAAVAGIGELPSADADAVLERLAARSDAELRAHCLATLARRRGAGRGR